MVGPGFPVVGPATLLTGFALIQIFSEESRRKAQRHEQEDDMTCDSQHDIGSR